MITAEAVSPSESPGTVCETHTEPALGMISDVTEFRNSRGFEHDALLYESEAQFVEGSLGFIGEGLEAGEPVLVVVAPDRIAALQTALGPDARRVRFADMRAVGANPAHIIPTWFDFAAEHRGRAVRGIGEPVTGDRRLHPAELVEAQCHELLLNLAFAKRADVRLLCPYDIATLDDDAIEQARASHVGLHDRGGYHRSDGYCDDIAAAVFGAPLSPVPDRADAFVFDRSALRAVRERVEAFTTRHALDRKAAGGFVLAVDEIATNSVRYGGGSGELRLWCTDDAIVCEVRDHGRITDPLAGRRRPTSDTITGRGIWIANRACDLVQIRAGASGTTVRLHAWL